MTNNQYVGRYTLLERLRAISEFSIKPEVCLDNKDRIYTYSHKIILEGVDFDLVYTPLKHLGYKAVVAAIGPIYAAGYTPFSISVLLALSSKLRSEQVEELWMGVAAAKETYKISKIGLDLLPSVTGLTISLSTCGEADRKRFAEKPVCTSGDLLCVNGDLGAAYMGLQILEREKRIFEQSSVQPNLERYKYPIQAYLNPRIDTTIIDTLNNSGITPSGGEFIVNGLADAIKSLCHRYNLGAKIFMDKIAIAAQTSEVADEFNINPVTAALNGGDDYLFLFVIPLSKYDKLLKEAPQLDIVGHLCDPAVGTVLVTPDGAELELKAQGWTY